MTISTERQLRHVFEAISGSTPDSGNPEYWDGDLLWATPEDVGSLAGYWLSDTRRKITWAGYKSCGTRLAAAGSIVLTKRAPIGQLAVLTKSACSNQGCFLLSPHQEADTRFFYYWLSAQTQRLQILGRGSTFMELSTDDLKSLHIPCPSLLEQRAIADYLDRATAHIDALIAAKQRLLALLAEKRRALITQAVTRGLDPSVPMRDSGVEWLGQVPAQWEVWKIGHFAITGNGSTPNRDNNSYWLDGTIPWLNSSVVNLPQVTEAEQFVTELAFRECHLPLVRPGSILVGITGQGKTRGQATILKFEATINQHMAFITPSTAQADSSFLCCVFQAAYDYLRSISDDAGGTKGALTCEQVAAFKVALPSRDEQRAIVAHIAAETAKLDALAAAAGRTIALLKERRAALIAAAVTGQIAVDYP